MMSDLGGGIFLLDLSAFVLLEHAVYRPVTLELPPEQEFVCTKT